MNMIFTSELKQRYGEPKLVFDVETWKNIKTYGTYGDDFGAGELWIFNNNLFYLDLRNLSVEDRKMVQEQPERIGGNSNTGYEKSEVFESIILEREEYGEFEWKLLEKLFTESKEVSIIKLNMTSVETFAE